MSFLKASQRQRIEACRLSVDDTGREAKTVQRYLKSKRRGRGGLIA